MVKEPEAKTGSAIHIEINDIYLAMPHVTSEERSLLEVLEKKQWWSKGDALAFAEAQVQELKRDILELAIQGFREAQNRESADCEGTFASIMEFLGIKIDRDAFGAPTLNEEQIKKFLEEAKP